MITHQDFDYFAEDEDPSARRSTVNAFLAQPYALELGSLASLVLFYFINGMLGDHAVHGKKKRE